MGVRYLLVATAVLRDVETALADRELTVDELLDIVRSAVQRLKLGQVVILGRSHLGDGG